MRITLFIVLCAICGSAPCAGQLSEPAPDTRDSTELSHAEIDVLRNSLAALPWAAKEVQIASSHLDGKGFVGAAATESDFKRQAGQYSIIHLATHALVDEDDPLNSKFVFAPETGGGEDGLLYPHEILGMQLDAELAVLNSCNTGYGKVEKGEGVLHLARGFLYAGCPSAIVNLWPVADAQSTSMIMANFYANLAEGDAIDKALRQARLDFLDDATPNDAAPFYWAGLTPIGNSAPIQQPGVSFRPGLILATVFVALALMVAGGRWIRKKKTKQI